LLYLIWFGRIVVYVRPVLRVLNALHVLRGTRDRGRTPPN